MSFFPIAEDLIENEGFRQLSPTEKVYYFWCVNQFNIQGEFYKSDLEVSVTLNCAEVTIRKARRKFQQMGWLSIKPGTRVNKGNHLATRYLAVKWSKTNECRWFAQQHRFTFLALLANLRENKIQHGDLWCYLYLSYCRWRYRGKGNPSTFSISIRVLTEATGLHDASRRVRRLHDRFAFSNGNHLFEVNGYHQLNISNWARFRDPDDEGGEKFLEVMEAWNADIAKEVAAIKQLRYAPSYQLTTSPS